MTGNPIEPILWFVTPVYRRFHLTKLCLQQRRRMIDRLPFKANCVVVGDDENLEVARELGFGTVEMDNEFVARKFNAGYVYACDEGEATHCMPIGSDSWLHESIFEDEPFSARGAIGIVGLSSYAPDGSERYDLAIRYPAGFGVGMVYPAYAVRAARLGGHAADPEKQRGIDNSTWARVGKGRVKIRFMDLKPHRYINFHSTEESITNFDLLKRGNGRTVGHEKADPFDVLRELYDADLIEELQRMYALRALQVFATGKQPVFFNPHQRPGRRYPQMGNRSGIVGLKADGTPKRYPNIGLRKRPSDADLIAERRDRKARGQQLSRDEEISLRFADQRGQ